MGDEADTANNDVTEQEQSTCSVLSPLHSSTKINKRLRTKVWDDFIPTFVDRKIAQAECMHCHQVFNCCGTNGTSSMLRHLAKCSTGTLKKPRQQEHRSLPSTHKCMIVAGSDLKQKKLSFLPSSQIKYTGAEDVTAVQKELEPLQNTSTNKNRNNQVDRDKSGEEAAKSEHLTLPDVSADKNRKNQCHEETVSPEQKDLPNKMSQEIDENGVHEEITKILAMHGHLPGMTDQDGFRKLVALLNPMFNMPSHNDLDANTHDLFHKERSKLKEKLAALQSRICLSANMWYYDPTLAFLCLTIHYIDDEWEKQEKVITFRAVGSSCNAKEMSDIILGAIGEWRLDGKIFSLMLDDAFIDDSVALSVKADLQERNPLSAKRSLFVVRSAAHLLDQVIQVGLDEFDKVMEKLAKFPKHTKGPNPSAVQCPNYRYAPSWEVWWTARNISETLDDLHKCIELMHSTPKPANIFDQLWDAKREIHRQTEHRSNEAHLDVLKKIQHKFEERWQFCFLHFCMPMVMNPECRLEHIKFHIRYNSNKEDHFREVHDTLLSLFNEYSNPVEDPNNCNSGSKNCKGAVADMDRLVQYYSRYANQCSERPMTELDQFVQDPHLSTSNNREDGGKCSVLQWWKEHRSTYPTIARMARDMLALPSSTDCKLATRIAQLAVSVSDSTHRIEELVCLQDWLTLTGTSTVNEESTDYI